jgi:hypothetical protein
MFDSKDGSSEAADELNVDDGGTFAGRWMEFQEDVSVVVKMQFLSFNEGML